MIYRATIKAYNQDGTIQILRANSDLYEAKVLGDFKPALDSEVICGQVGNNPEDLIILAYYDEVAKVAQVGEKRIYSTKEGSLAANIYLNQEGVIDLNEGEDFAVKFNELKAGFDQLKTDFNSFASSFNTHVHTTTSLGSPTTTPMGGAPPIPVTIPSSTASVDNAKQEKIKL